jgi:hypothetical protein
MTCSGNCGLSFKFLKNIDIFDKSFELYYKGKSKKSTYIGSIFTICYGVIYFSFFLYKILRMINKRDITFYDTTAHLEEIPEIDATNENFYGGFALEHPETYDNFIDETIYYPKAYYKIGRLEGDDWIWTIKEIELEKCQLEKFGSTYKDKFKNKKLNNLYCFKNVNDKLLGHFSYDYYSFYFIQLFPCRNTTENSKCQTREKMDYYLKSTFVSFQLQDIEITPLNFSHPVIGRDLDVYATVGKKLFQELHVLYQIVDIETDLDLLGFSDFQNVRTEKYLKYNSLIQMTNILENDLYETGESFCNITIKLTEKVLTERRRYTKLIEVMRDVGGFMEVILSVFKIVSLFSTNILYEKSLVNCLFEFDIDRKNIIIHNKYQNKLTKKINLDKKISKRNEYELDYNILNNDVIATSKNNLNNNKLKNYYENNLELDKINRRRSNLRPMRNNINRRNFIRRTINNINIIKNIDIYNYKNKGEELDGTIINKIKINKCCIYFCFLCVRKRKNMENILLDEGMRIIIEKLDIINIFKSLYRDDMGLKEEKVIIMSNNCIKRLNEINRNT